MPERTSLIWEETTASYGYSDNNFTTEPNVYSCPPPNLAEAVLLNLKIERWSLGLEFFLATLGNFCILALLWMRREKWTKMQLFILHLAIADLLVAFFLVFPEWLIRMLCGFHAGNTACKLHKYMQVIGMYGTTFILLGAAFDRYRAICYPMQSFRASRKRAHFSVAVLWLLSAILALPQLFVFEKNGDYPSCEQPTWLYKHPYFNKIYVIWYLLVILIIPTILLTYFYGMIALMIMRNLSEKKNAVNARNGVEESEVLTQRNQNRGNFAPRASSIAVISRAKIKTVKMTLVIVVTYIVCWTPFFVAQMLVAFGYKNAGTAVFTLQLLGCVNSCTNPWIYMCFSGNLFADLKRIVCCIKKKPKAFSLQPRANCANHSNLMSYAHSEGIEQTTSYSIDSPTSRIKRGSDQVEMTEITTVSSG